MDKQPPTTPIATEEVLATFFDILGFTRIVETKDAPFIHKVLTKLRKHTLPNDPDRDDFGVDAIAFSDSIIRRVCIQSKENQEAPYGVLYTELELLGWIQSALLYEDEVLLRGGMVIGDLFLDDNIVFGKALIDAYALENKYAIFPRIILHESIEKTLQNNYLKLGSRKHDLKEEQRYISRLTWVDFDGHRFIDYLASIDLCIESLESWRGYLLHHKDFVTRQSALSKDNSKLLARASFITV